MPLDDDDDDLPKPVGRTAAPPSSRASAPPRRSGFRLPFQIRYRVGGSLRRAATRLVLWSLPVAVVAIAVMVYLASGRWVSTDNAYVKGDRALVAADVSGPIVEVAVIDNQRVKKGDLLLRLDDEPYKIALERAEADLAFSRTEVASLKASHREKQEEIKMAQSQETYAAAEHRRQSDLAKQRINTAQRVDETARDLDMARQRIAMLGEDLARIVTALAGDPAIDPNDHPKVREKRAQRDEAARRLARTRLVAPFDGIVARKPAVGNYIAAGVPAVAVVADEALWVEANFKETDLTRVKPGQRVIARIDSYPDLEWRGRVTSIAQATGAEFAVLPPQNASGNWVKVVQRIPVKIEVEARPGDPALRVGMSATIEIDTGRQRTMDDVWTGVARTFGFGGASASREARPAGQ